AADRCRASHPMTTAIPAAEPEAAAPAAVAAWTAPGPCSCSHPASAAVAALTTARFIRFGPAPTWPRSPAVPKCRRPPHRAGDSAGAVGPRRPPRLVPPPGGGEQRPQLVLVAGIRILADPGLYLGAQAVGDHGVRLMRARPAAGCRRAGRLSGPRPRPRPR